MTPEHGNPGGGRWKTGARPTPRHKLLAAQPFKARAGLPDRHAWLGDRYDPWGNDAYGDCVSAEEAFAKAVFPPRVMLTADQVISWARQHGFLNGADLAEVMDAMQHDGYMVGTQQYNDGGYKGVDYSNESVLRSALEIGPVKIAIASGALPRGAGQSQGWHSVGENPRPDHNTDHCVSLAGYGPCSWLYEQLKLPLPSGISPDAQAYLLYTWATVGVVDHPWLMSTCSEAWIRQPTTTGAPPLPDPTPTPTPTPPAPPTPTPPAPPGPQPGPNWLNILVTLLPIILQLIQQFLPHLQRMAAQGNAPGGSGSGPGQGGYEFGHAQQPSR